MIRSALLSPILLGAALLAGDCSTVAAPAEGPVGVQATTEGSVVHNRSDRPARYLAYTPGWLALVSLAPCSDVDDPCPRVAAGATITIPWSMVGGYSPTIHDYRLDWSLVGPPPASGRVELTWPPGPLSLCVIPGP